MAGLGPEAKDTQVECVLICGFRTVAQAIVACDFRVEAGLHEVEGIDHLEANVDSFYQLILVEFLGMV